MEVFMVNFHNVLTNDLQEVIDKLNKQKLYLQDQLKKAGIEINNLEAEVKYERQLRIQGATSHVDTQAIKSL